MKIQIRNSKPKGVALAFALMTALLLMTLSTTVVGLSMRHARSGSESDYAQEALYAADWYLNAALDYMKAGGITVNQKVNGFDNPYTDSYDLQSIGYGASDPVLGRADVSATVIDLDSAEKAKEYGVDPANDPKLLRFRQLEGQPLVYFPSEDVSDAYNVNDRFAVCDVVVEKGNPQVGKFNTKGTAGFYHLTIYSRVYDGSAADAVRKVQQSGKTGIGDYPTEGLLSTRVVDVVARNEGPLDYLHIIQDCRSWRAQGINLDGGDNSLFSKMLNTTNKSDVDKYMKNGLAVCGLPDGYTENGRLRIDGGTRMSRENIEKYGKLNFKNLKDSEGNDIYIDGTARFFNNTNKNYAKFNGELTQRYSLDTMKYTQNLSGKGALSEICGGGLRDNEDSIGLPQNGENPNYDKDGKRIVKAYNDRYTYQKFAKETAKDMTGTTGMYSAVFEINGKVGKKNTAASGVYVGSVPEGVVPDVYNDGTGNDIRPSFAKIVVELGDSGGKAGQSNVFIYKENAGKRQLIKSINSSKINNGILSVTGGNVEVRSHNGQEFDGDLTIVSDVEATREDSLNLFGVKDGGDFSKESGAKQPSAIRSRDSIYSDAARAFYEEQQNRIAGKDTNKIAMRTVNGKKVPMTPPYTIQELKTGMTKLGIKSGNDPVLSAYNVGKNPTAYVWPTPTSEATEREGNVYITSDIKCKTTNGKRGTVGIVAKNYISLNDKDIHKKSGNQELSVEAMMFSFDKSVQFDWNNDAKNPNFNILRTGAKKRKFTLTGCVVSSNLDIEGSINPNDSKDTGVGYLVQEERSNLSVDNPAPFLPGYANGTGRWVIVSYTDTGSRNWF